MVGTDSRKSDVAIGATLLAFCAFAAWRTAYVHSAPATSVAGSAFVPWLVIALISALASILIVRAVLSMRSGRTGETVSLPDRGTFVRMGLFAVLMVAYAGAFMSVGYIPSTLVAFVAGLVLFGERRIWVLILLPCVATTAVYYAFTTVLAVWLP
ncbi:putative tricarboxylic transport membrane protein [Breoghania corrubedonensis]|uniref:Putative tricarboxylic transport membrane protein n=1 Tax=Breoghania corrubedonensis TaxID=665038 RepID=A0A2T5VHH4_9HYPH|nr:tripartite tricarboxylate transporter TctB family protein [Breoghania corrubedonensis]PTW63209.1 putative tricarboxylic transport membrane protein [Breoghania corrubedonensis]